MNIYLIGYLILINIVTFVIWGIDKRKAVKNKWRISEKQLLILTFLGGFVGGILGMQLFRHKTVKSRFLYFFWVLVVLWLLGLGLILF